MAVFCVFCFVTWGSYYPPMELMFNREHCGKGWFNVYCLQNVFTVISFDSQKQLRESGIIRTLLMKQELGISSRGTIARSWQSWDSKEREMSDKDLRYSSGSSAQYSVTA